MGNYNISINGIGCHHNDQDYDADRLAANLVSELKDKGHTIESATFTHGGAESLMELPRPGREAMGDTAAYEKGFADAEAKMQKAESVRLHREYNKLVAAQQAGAKNAADVVRLTDECAAKGIVLVPGGENE